MKLLILLIAIGVIGIIGAIDESDAETILTIPEPDNYPTSETSTTSIATSASRDFWFIGVRPHKTFSDANNDTGTIYIPTSNRDYLPINKNILFKGNEKTTRILSCVAKVESLQTIINMNLFPNFTTPRNVDLFTGIGIDVKPFKPSNTHTCPIDLEAPSKYPLITKKELRITLYNQHDKKAYYFSPRENITEAQPIPLCTNSTINLNDQTLKGDTKMCYGKHGNNMVIITKKLSGFYGAANSITTPTIKYALNSDRNDTVEYLELLKKLYLPAI